MKDPRIKWIKVKYYWISLTIVLLVVLSACGGSSTATETSELVATHAVTDSPTPTVSSATPTTTPPSVAAAERTPSATSSSAPSTPAIEPSPESEEGSSEAVSDELPDDPTLLMLATLVRPITAVAQKMADSGNTSYIPVLLELLRFQNQGQAQIMIAGLINKMLEGSDSLDIPAERKNWDWWVEWLGNHPEIQAPDGFAGWKGRLYSFLDPNFGEFLYDGVKTRIRLEEVVWGGVRKDGIPDLINPPAISAAAATFLEPSDRVFGVSFNDESRAYPLRILNPHEMANDVVGGVHFALAY